MDEFKLREIIREELGSFVKSDRFTFEKLIQILDGRNVQTGRTTGTKIGIATNNLLGFYGVTPVDQPATISDAATQGGTYNQTDVQSIATAVNTIIDRLQELGLIA